MEQTSVQLLAEKLESRQAFQDELIDSLNQEVIRLSEQVQKQQVQIEYLAKRLAAHAPSNLASEQDETPPPHY
ncbi:SlyX family protein [Paraferrimonas haliotis]|uniref:Protein SlyX homolog n=1 Tax=Paraferrimonas haliotis TaxID=2013866 RepID=A0AA37WXD5_9GAMM|nr:SlyX family protein [Paraferrimonas haliotis]GLS83344.1 protein SlyX [Paraferrimonas haliotis]